LRNQFGQPRLPFVYGRLIPEWPGDSQDVRAGQQALTNLLSDVFMVNTDDLYNPNTGILHYNNNATITVGNRYAAGLAVILSSRSTLSIEVSGAVHLRVYGRPNTVYEVQHIASLASTNWQQLITGQTDVLGIFDCQDGLPLDPARYYRFILR
jgi:hypothetical protein